MSSRRLPFRDQRSRTGWNEMSGEIRQHEPKRWKSDSRLRRFRYWRPNSPSSPCKEVRAQGIPIVSSSTLRQGNSFRRKSKRRQIGVQMIRVAEFSHRRRKNKKAFLRADSSPFDFDRLLSVRRRANPKPPLRFSRTNNSRRGAPRSLGESQNPL